MKTTLAAAVLVWSAVASADERKTRTLDSITRSGSFAVHGDYGLAGIHDHMKVPADWADHEYISSCSRNRHASIVRPDGSTYEIITANGRDYLDYGFVQAENGELVVGMHTRREVTRVATIADVGVWAYRESGYIHFGTFADFGMNDRYVSFGCRWTETMVREGGGTIALSSAPSMSEVPPGFLTHPEPKPTGPTFSFTISVSRSSSDASTLVIMRTRDH